MSTERSEEQSLKAQPEMDVKPEGSSAVASFEQLSKAYSPIDTTPEGMLIEPSEEHPWKLSLPM